MNTPYAWFISNSAGTQVSTYWWSLSPVYWDGSSAGVWGWYPDVANLGSSIDVSNTFDVRPAVSLKSCTKWASGDGSSSNPYTIKETTSGC